MLRLELLLGRRSPQVRGHEPLPLLPPVIKLFPPLQSLLLVESLLPEPVERGAVALLQHPLPLQGLDEGSTLLVARAGLLYCSTTSSSCTQTLKDCIGLAHLDLQRLMQVILQFLQAESLELLAHELLRVEQLL